MIEVADLGKKGVMTSELVARLSKADLVRLTNGTIDSVLAIIADCGDADVTFIPVDLEAYDSAAASAEEVDLAWTLGHVIVHITASAEEAAAIASEMARGVPDRGGRSRYEVPWQTVTTIDQCRRRLEESRRMRLASLEMWPDEPALDNLYELWNGMLVNAFGRFLSGLRHDGSHLDQIREIVRQAKAAPVAAS